MEALWCGSEYVNWQLRVPARFWTTKWAKEKFGDAWKSTEWLVKVIKHRPKSKKCSEEWAFRHEGDEFFFSVGWKNTFLKEGRLTGLFCLCSLCHLHSL